MQGSTAPRPRAAAAAVPAQHGPALAATGDAARRRESPALPSPRSAPGLAPSLPPELMPGARAGVLPRLRPRSPAQPDSVEFTAACPACGQDCAWSEEREDTRCVRS